MSGHPLITALFLYNLVVLSVYGIDKSKARRGQWRIPERTLLWLAALYGGVGALGAMYLFHHKTHKPRFKLGVPAMLFAQVALAWFGHSRGWW